MLVRPGGDTLLPARPMRHVLFVCSQNRLRSPTAEKIFAEFPGIEVASAGIDDDAEAKLTLELVAWADIIFVMEEWHRRQLSTKFPDDLEGKKIICLNIPDEFAFMDATLVSILKSEVPGFLNGS